MKKLISSIIGFILMLAFIISAFLLMYSCNEEKATELKPEPEPEPGAPIYDPKLIPVKLLPNSSATGINIVTIDSCDYIMIVSHNHSSIVHKANCKNPKH